MSRLLPDIEGRGLLVADAVGTGLLLLVTVVSGFTQADAVELLSLIVAGVLFVGGCVAFGIGFLRAVGRSRDEEINLAGLFYLTGSAPLEARRAFLGLWYAQIAIAVGSIVVARPWEGASRPADISPPFGVMAPLWGIGLITWWASRHATFPPREGVPRK